MARARISLWLVVPIAAVAVAGGVAAGVTLDHHATNAPSKARATASRTGATSHAGQGDNASNGGGRGSSGAGGGSSSGTGGTSPAGTGSTTTTAPKPPPLAVTSTSPAARATNVAPSGAITVQFSAPLAADSPTPSLSPSTQGSWAVHGSTMTFTPTVPFLPLSTVTVAVPAGTAGPRGAAGGQVRTAYRTSFQVQNGSYFRLDQLLSILDYSPLSWTPKGPPIATGGTAAQVEALYKAPLGHFAWRQAGWPTQLTALWHPGHWDVMTRGLVMSFEADHGLTTNGTIDANLWKALLAALAQHEHNTGGYNFALASKHLPESLTIWHDGKVVLHAPANTGIAVRPTNDGIFPVYSRLRNQIMKGTNPDGSHYADPVQFVAYFNGGDAVHYIPRAKYGFPQSLGCVEVDLSDAAKAWPYLAYGTLVDVTG